MASILARHAFGTLRRARVPQLPRSIHTTPVALKKKGRVVNNDLLEEDAFVEEDLIKVEHLPMPESTTATSESVQLSEAAALNTAPVKTHKVKLDSAARQQQFDEQYKYVELRIGRSPSIQKQRVRKRHFLTLLDLAQSKEDVRRVVDLVPRYREAGGELMDSFSEELARRCQELQCQSIALEVFGNFAKYNVQLDINAARWLVHSLYAQHPLEKVLIATSLYPAYNLPPVSKDLATASMLAAACYRHGTSESIKAAEALQPHIRNMVEKAELGTAPDHATRKQNKWITWALRRVNEVRKAKKPFISQNKLPLKIEIQKPQAAAQTQVSNAKPITTPATKPSPVKQVLKA